MRLVIAATAIAALALTACGKKPEADKPSVTVNANGYTVKGNDGSATITTGSGAASAAAAKTPDFAPVYPGATVESTIAGVGSENGEGQGGSVVFNTRASPQQVIDFYKQKTGAAGLTPQMSADMGQALMFAASDDATKRGVQVIVSGKDGGSNVTVTWATPKS